MNNPRLWSVLDIVKQFNLLQFVDILNRIRAAEDTAGHMRFTGVIPLVDCQPHIDLCDRAITFGLGAGFEHTVRKARSVKQRMEKLPQLFDSSAVEGELRSLEGDIASDMMDCIFVQIKRESRPFYENAELLGPIVLQGFPICKDDIVSAGNCIAVELGTSAVFHLMRIAEIGLRAFARHLGLSHVVANRKRGKTIPMEYAQWEKILSQLPEKIESKLNLVKPGPQKQKKQEFYYSNLNEISSFKDAWRNHVMHVRRTYSPEDAAAIVGHVRRFMESLAEHRITLKVK